MRPSQTCAPNGPLAFVRSDDRFNRGRPAPTWLMTLALVCVAALLATGCGPVRITEPPAPIQERRVEPRAPLPTDTPVLPIPGTEPGATTVALLLPLSGEHAALGQAMLDAAQMAVFELADESFVLLPKDTRGTPGGAAAAVEEAVAQGAELVLGPLLASSVTAASPAVRQNGLKMIAFSNDRSVAGDGIYLLGFLPDAEVERVVRHAANEGRRRIAALAPETSYGRLVVAALERSARAEGATAGRVAFIDPEADMMGMAQVVEGFSDHPRRERALVDRRRELQQRDDPEARRMLRSLVGVGAFGEPPFDAVMLPMTGQMLREVASLLPFYDIHPGEVRVLGTGQWGDQSDLGAEAALVGAWFAAPSPDMRAEFEERYAETYGEPPPRLASLAYDAAALAAVLATMEGGPAYDDATFTATTGFTGADGLFRFRSDGAAERGLAILEVTREGVRVVDPAPMRFEEDLVN